MRPQFMLWHAAAYITPLRCVLGYAGDMLYAGCSCFLVACSFDVTNLRAIRRGRCNLHASSTLWVSSLVPTAFLIVLQGMAVWWCLCIYQRIMSKPMGLEVDLQVM